MHQAPGYYLDNRAIINGDYIRDQFMKTMRFFTPQEILTGEIGWNISAT
jgi:hypothetical protein